MKFIKGNLRKILPVTITVCLSVLLLYFLSLTMSHIINQNIEFTVDPLSNMSVISGTSVKVSVEDIKKDYNKLKEYKYIKEFYTTNINKVNLKTNTSNNYMFLFLMQNKNIPKLMKYEKLKLIEGRLPKNNGEILLHKKLVANYTLKLGAIVHKNSVGWEINEDVKVVGIIDGRAVLGLGATNKNLTVAKGKDISLITVTDDESVGLMNSFIEKTFGMRYEYLTLDLMKKEINNKNRNIQTIMDFIEISIIIVLSVLLGNICMIQYTQRSKEFELLHAIGFTKKYIAAKVFKEIGFSAIFGYILGVLLAMVLGWLMNVCLLGEKLLGMQLVIISNMLWILFVPILVTLSGMITPIRILKFKDIM